MVGGAPLQEAFLVALEKAPSTPGVSTFFTSFVFFNLKTLKARGCLMPLFYSRRNRCPNGPNWDYLCSQGQKPD